MSIDMVMGRREVAWWCDCGRRALAYIGRMQATVVFAGVIKCVLVEGHKSTHPCRGGHLERLHRACCTLSILCSIIVNENTSLLRR